MRLHAQTVAALLGRRASALHTNQRHRTVLKCHTRVSPTQAFVGLGASCRGKRLQCGQLKALRLQQHTRRCMQRALEALETRCASPMLQTRVTGWDPWRSSVMTLLNAVRCRGGARDIAWSRNIGQL